MKENREFIIRFNDLKEEVQEKIINTIYHDIMNDKEKQEYLHEVCGSDPYDLGRPNGGAIIDHVNGCIDMGTHRSWASWIVEVKI